MDNTTPHCIETWTKSYIENNTSFVRSLNRFSNNTYVILVSHKDILTPYGLWIWEMPIEVTGFVNEHWNTHRMFDESQKDWVDVYP